MTGTGWDRYPRLSARTQGFSLGRPRSLRIARDGSRLCFLRSAEGDDPVQALWVMNVDTGDVDTGDIDTGSAGVERCVLDPRALDDGDDGDVPPEERARRERAREQARGVVRYDVDDDMRRAVTSLAGACWVVDLDSGQHRRVDVEGAVVDPRLRGDGRAVAWVGAGAVHVTDLDGDSTTTLVSPEGPWVTYGLPDFVAAEEMGRTRGFWWSPSGDRLLVARVDTSRVERWWIAAPVDPSVAPQEVAYPAAGTPNAEVTLHVVGTDGARRDVRWDRADLPYVVAASWEADGAVVTVQSRDQRRLVHLRVDADSGATEPCGEQTAQPWTEIVAGVPAWHRGRLVTVVDDPAHDVRRVALDGRPQSPADLDVRAVLDVSDRGVWFTASAADAAVVDVHLLCDGVTRRLSDGDGVASATVGGDTTALTTAALDRPRVVTRVSSPSTTHVLADHSLDSPITPRVRRLDLGPHRLPSALLRPADVPDDVALPVLLDPYGGPHAQRVVASQAAYRTSQWFADAGYAVLVTDGRGTPGRGLRWEHAVHHDLAAVVLADQLDALDAAAQHSALDLDRVAIRGWSFGGYLAALAVLDAPERVHAAIAGAPVTEWRLYDTHYTERYLGTPDDHPEVYDAASLLPRAAGLRRPLLLIHGLADDNVVVAHTLRLSQALLEAGRPHRVLPLSGVTHMTSQDVVAESLLRLQLDFLAETVGAGPR